MSTYSVSQTFETSQSILNPQQEKQERNIRFKLVGFSGSDEQAVSELSGMIDILL